MNRELLMLAKPYTLKYDVAGWFCSEKLDGQRAFWDGGVSRNAIVRNIPWANQGNVKRLVGVSTGLWSRYGNVICAPEWWIDSLPIGTCLDGELYLGPGMRQETMSITKRLVPDDRWQSIRFSVFDSPCYSDVFADGIINNPNFQTNMNWDDCSAFLDKRSVDMSLGSGAPFDTMMDRLRLLGKDHQLGKFVDVLDQTALPFNHITEAIHKRLDLVVSHNGEGLMLRRPYSYWAPHRSSMLLKVKPHHDSEAIVVGYTGGLGKYKGMLGALVIQTVGDVSLRLRENIVFELSGFTDIERSVSDHKLFGQYGGKRIPDELTGIVGLVPAYPLGSVVTFRFNGLTRDGIPSEARII